MLIRIGYDIVFELPAPTPMVLLLSVFPDREPDLQQPFRLTTEPETPLTEYIDTFGSRCHRLLAPAGSLRLRADTIIKDSGEPDPQNADAFQHPIEELPNDTLQFLMASRYCEVDLMGDIAWNLFGETPLGWQRVQAVCDWVHANIKYDYSLANPTKTALQTYEQRGGVCRDFAHIAVTLCRCMNIPARYVTGWLGDIQADVLPTPMDFHAWFEVYLGGAWHTFDARHNVPRIGRVLMAKGRDAVDVSIATTFGPHTLVKFEVTADEISE